MKNIRRSSAAVATVATLALALTACSSGGDNDAAANDTPAASPSAEELIKPEQSVGAMEDFKVGTTFKATEPVDFSLMYRDHPNYPVKEDWEFFTALKANQNVSFTRTDIPLSDWDNKRALLFGAGDFPDITSVMYPGQESQFVASGALLPVSDYLQYMPNFSDKVEKWGLSGELDALRQSDGKFYLLPGLREVPDVQYTVCPNDDMWKAAGITEDPKTWDEFAADLKKVKDANPTIKFAMSERWNTSSNWGPLGALMQTMGPTFNTVGGWGYAPTSFNKKDGKFELTATSAGTKDMVTYLAGLVSDGLLDPQITQDDDTANAKFLNGESATISCNTQGITNDIRKKAADTGKTINTHLMVIPGGPAGNVIAGSRLAQGVVLNADVAEKPYFKALLQFVDWLYFSDEGIEFAVWGDANTFTKDASGARVLNADINGNNQNPDGAKKLQADFGFYNGVFMAGTGSTADLVQSTMNDEIRGWTKTIIDGSDLRPANPPTPMDADTREALALLETQVHDAAQTGIASFITGEKPLSDWDAFVSQLDGLGGSQIVDDYNTAYQAAKK
ncbi:extracellular solute-binding protein [Xylanimonas protaetiae]|uniref:Extracellular solute-binding protein n=1 Tax=Xylanimonas protaetiae TaxID=2509457 RepID=A0A4P6FGX9_9MICO|nr:extracellular solute-binding protein [Xylanimonas protaetiae]QAY69868.1 extracellular solute-binding protein [Xylanimonas protaetiae]